jgi:hypothetical protein
MRMKARPGYNLIFYHTYVMAFAEMEKSRLAWTFSYTSTGQDVSFFRFSKKFVYLTLVLHNNVLIVWCGLL